MSFTHSTPEQSITCEEYGRKCRSLCKWNGLATWLVVLKHYLTLRLARWLILCMHHRFSSYHSLMYCSYPHLQVRKLRLGKSQSPRVPEQRRSRVRSEPHGAQLSAGHGTLTLLTGFPHSFLQVNTWVVRRFFRQWCHSSVLLWESWCTISL